MLTRILTAAVALPVLLAIILYAPPEAFSVFIALVTASALYEIFEMTPERSAVQALLVFLVGGIPAYLSLFRGVEIPALTVAALLLMILITVLVAARRTPLAGPTVFAVVGALYVGALFPYFALLRDETDGVSRLIFILLLVIAGDSAAYFVGSNIGRIKIAPAVSPGKTLEGSIASIAGSIVAALVLRSVFVPDLNFGLTVQLGALVNIAAQVGDLAESALKRIARVKDSGRIFPGHGGLLDRADSLVFAAVFSYYFFLAMRPLHAPH